MDYIHVCFALHDEYGNYSKYLGIAIKSIFENTNSKIYIHILCDGTISDINKNRFFFLAKEYSQELKFYQIDTTSFTSLKNRVAGLSIGTLFRLKMIDVLPDYLQRVIYLDDDLLVNMDIKELWDIDLTDYVLAACRDPGISSVPELPYPCVAGWVSSDDYFNAGVMVINMTKLRLVDCFTDKCLEFLKRNPKCSLVDQDVFNVFFKNKVIYLPKCYNLFTRNLRKEKDNIHNGICHYAADYVDPAQLSWFDKMFFRYWEQTPWNTGEEIFPYFLAREQQHIKQMMLWQKVFSVFVSRERKIVIWGRGVLCNRLKKISPMLVKPDWYVDNNINLQGNKIDGIEVMSPEKLADIKCIEKPYVIVMSKRYYGKISSELEGYGYKEFDDYCDGALLLLMSQGGRFSGY